LKELILSFFCGLLIGCASTQAGTDGSSGYSSTNRNDSMSNDVPVLDMNNIINLPPDLPLHSVDLIQFSGGTEKNFNPVGTWINEFQAMYTAFGEVSQFSEIGFETERLEIQKGNGNTFNVKFVQSKRKRNQRATFFTDEKIVFNGKLTVKGNEAILTVKAFAADIGYKEAKSLQELEQAKFGENSQIDKSMVMNMIYLFQYDPSANVLRKMKELSTPPKGSKPIMLGGKSFLGSAYTVYEYNGDRVSYKKDEVRTVPSTNMNTAAFFKGAVKKGIFKNISAKSANPQ